MATMVRSFAIQGIEGYPIEIEATLLDGMPMLSIIGLGDQAVREAGERIQAAVFSAGYEFPKKKVIISLAPGDIRKRGSHFDLGMALSILQEAGEIGARNLSGFGVIGEMALNGAIRPCTGVLPMIMAAAQNGIEKVIVPSGNYKEAKLIKNLTFAGE